MTQCHRVRELMLRVGTKSVLFGVHDFPDKPEFAFLGRKVVKELDIARAVEQMTEDTYEDAELTIGDDDWKALLAAVDAFNAKYKVTYYEDDYKRKVRVR